MKKTFIFYILTFLLFSCQIETKNQTENIDFLVGEWIEKTETDTINFRLIQGLVFEKDEKTGKIYQMERHALGFSEDLGETNLKFMDKNTFILTRSLYQIQDTFSYLNDNGNEEILRLKDQKKFIKKNIQNFFLNQISGSYKLADEMDHTYQIKIDKNGNLEHLYLGSSIYLEENWSYTNVDLISFKDTIIPKTFGLLYTKEKLFFYYLNYNICCDCIPVVLKDKLAFTLIRVE